MIVGDVGSDYMLIDGDSEEAVRGKEQESQTNNRSHEKGNRR